MQPAPDRGERDAREARAPRDFRDSRDSRAPRDFREPREPRRERAPQIEPGGELVPFRIEVGRMHDVSPREIVGAIANEAGLPSHCIGRIEIYDEFSVVGLPADLPADVLGVLRKTRVMHQPLEIRRAGADDVPPPGRPSARARRRASAARVSKRFARAAPR